MLYLSHREFRFIKKHPVITICRLWRVLFLSSVLNLLFWIWSLPNTRAEHEPNGASTTANALIRPAFGCSYPLIRKKWFAKMQFKQLRIKAERFDDYFHDTCLISKKDMIAFMQANTSYQLKDAIKNCCADTHVFTEKKRIAVSKISQKLSTMLFQRVRWQNCLRCITENFRIIIHKYILRL